MMRILVDVYAADGVTRLGDGPVMTCISAKVKRNLDGAGSINLRFPAEDRRALELIQNERQVRIYVEEPGTGQALHLRELGRGVIRNIKLDARDTRTALSADGPDSLDALTRRTVRLNRQYAAQTISTIAADLVGLVPGWSVTVEDAVAADLQSARFAGTSALKALIRVAEEKGVHLREGTAANSLELGAFGTQTSIVVTNIGSVTQGIQRNDELILIDGLTEAQTSKSVVNYVIPIGAGEGQAATTLKRSTRTSPYTVGSLVDDDGGTVYYLEDAASIAVYGQNEKIITFKNIGPIANTEAAKVAAANALYDAAAAWLERNAVEQVTYSVSGVKARQTVRPGDKVRLVYKGEVWRDNMPLRMIDVDDWFWVLSVTETANDNGLSIDLEISSIDQMERDAARDIVGTLEAMQVRNVAIATYPFWSENTWQDHIQASSSPASSSFKRASFKIEIDNSIVDIAKVRIRFKTFPFFTTALVTTSTTWDGKLIGYLLNHTNYPYQMALEINGVDVTSALGGPWGNGVSGVDVTLDITNYIVEASGGLYQDHSIEFVPTALDGQAEYPGYGSVPVSALASSGRVELNIRVQGTCQAILPE